MQYKKNNAFILIFAAFCLISVACQNKNADPTKPPTDAADAVANPMPSHDAKTHTNNGGETDVDRENTFHAPTQHDPLDPPNDAKPNREEKAHQPVKTETSRETTENQENPTSHAENAVALLTQPVLTEHEAKRLQNAIQALWRDEASPDDFNAYIDEITVQSPNPEAALRFLYEFESRFSNAYPSLMPKIRSLYRHALYTHPALNALPTYLKPDRDISSIKRLGGGSTLVYKLYKNGQTIAAFKPLQSRYQSNYRSEIAAYRFGFAMKCGFDVPRNFPVYFDFKEFSGLYARNSANLKTEFKEILPTRIDKDLFRVDGTFKQWIPDFADFPIEMTELWKDWLNPGFSKADLNAPLEQILPLIEKKHPRGKDFTQKLQKHIQNTTKYALAKQISNLIVFDFLINNWDRFSGLKDFYGVNCQIANGRFMSIDNGASFANTPNPKPQKNLHRIQRFSKVTYDAIRAFDKNELLEFLFPNASKMEIGKIDTLWKLRQEFLDYIDSCIKKNGEDETFFFE